jgi:hypothetical protein
MKRLELTRRELADMTESNRDTVKYLDNGFRGLVESRHVFRDDDEREDSGDAMIGCKFA